MKAIIWISLFVSYTLFSYCVFKYADESHHKLSVQAQRGKTLFQEKNCYACHQIYGLGGYLGPDLTHVISNPAKGRAYAQAILQVGVNKMPNYHFSKSEVEDILTYLTEVEQY